MRTDKDREVCDSKVLYDTEFEAILAANRQDEEFHHYRCPGTGHYHITHTDKTKRLGYGFYKAECPICKKVRRRKGMAKHMRRCNGA